MDEGFDQEVTFKAIDVVDIAYGSEIMNDLMDTYSCVGGEEVVKFLNEINEIATSINRDEQEVFEMLSEYRGKKFVLVGGYTRVSIIHSIYSTDKDAFRNSVCMDYKMAFEICEFSNGWFRELFSGLAVSKKNGIENYSILKSKSLLTTLFFLLLTYDDNSKGDRNCESSAEYLVKTKINSMAYEASFIQLKNNKPVTAKHEGSVKVLNRVERTNKVLQSLKDGVHKKTIAGIKEVAYYEVILLELERLNKAYGPHCNANLLEMLSNPKDRSTMAAFAMKVVNALTSKGVSRVAIWNLGLQNLDASATKAEIDESRKNLLEVLNFIADARVANKSKPASEIAKLFKDYAIVLASKGKLDKKYSDYSSTILNKSSNIKKIMKHCLVDDKGLTNYRNMVELQKAYLKSVKEYKSSQFIEELEALFKREDERVGA